MKGEWLENLTMEDARRSCGAEWFAAALEVEREYTRIPRLDAQGHVAAELRMETPGLHGLAKHQVVLSVYPSYGVAGRCIGCPGWSGQCLAVHALVADLAVSAELRSALLGVGSMTSALEGLAARRRAVNTEALVQRVAFEWIPSKTEPLAVEFHLLPKRETHDSYGYSSRVYGFDPRRPYLEIRVRKAGTHSQVGPADPYAKWLCTLDRRILDLSVPLDRQRKGWRASGVHASMALQLLRDRVTVLEGTRKQVRFASDPLAPRLEPASLRRSELALSMRLTGPLLSGASSHAKATDEQPVAALEARWSLTDGSQDLRVRDTLFFSGPHPFVWVPSIATFFPLSPDADQDAVWALYLNPAAELVQGREAYIFGALLRSLRRRGVALPSRDAMGVPDAEVPKLTVYLDGTALALRARLVAEYTFGRFELRPGAKLGESSRDQGPERNEPAEGEALTTLLASGLAFEADRGRFEAAEDGAAAFWTNGLGVLRAATKPPIKLMIPSFLERTRVRSRIRSHLSLGLLEQELSAAATFESEGVEVEMAELRLALQEKRRWVMLRDGSCAKLVEPTVELLDDVLEVMGGASYTTDLPAHHLGRMDRWTELSDEARVDGAVESLRTRLRAMAVNDCPEVPESLRATLRAYQAQGLAWLQFLDALGAGGILADDMGLGKTVMALALMLWRATRDGTQPSLVVCPTSVMQNWISEAARFTPSLRTLLLHGTGRAGEMRRLPQVDLVVTTYALMRRDIDALHEVQFRYVVLDEAQNIKNPDASTTRAARKLRAQRRLALTGTPVENNLMEFWSLVDFCNPRILSSRASFERRFAHPMTENPTGPQAASLRAIVRPFLLRRTKAQVLTELPPKQEIDLYCTLTTRQRRSYDMLAAVLLEQVEENLREYGLARTHINALTALLRLRQVAVDPRLVDGRQPAASSAKRLAFLELVRQLRDEGRRALVFSQFVELLSLWRADLDAEGIGYQYLDGSTRNRAAVVSRFQAGSDPLFLISLKAGGSGLNLTAADTVIHCDPWWNPAVEEQATDRTHRIGQTRAVTVYRLIARGTVEEKIQRLKQAKREIARAVLSEESGALRGLTEADIRLLLGAADGEDVVDDDETVPVETVAQRPAAARGKRMEDGRVRGPALLEAADAVRKFMSRTGSLQKNVAEMVGASAPEISLLLKGTLASLPKEIWARALRLQQD